MRWTKKIKNKGLPKVDPGTIIVKNKFAFLPRFIDNTWVWLERIRVTKVYKMQLEYHGGGIFMWEIIKEELC